MKFLGETNCLVFTDLSHEEHLSFFEKFGDLFWNESEGIICIPTKALSDVQKRKYEMFFATRFINAEFLIVLL